MYFRQLAEKNNKEDNQEQGEEVCVPQNAMVDPEVDNDTTEVQNSAQENEMVRFMYTEFLSELEIDTLIVYVVKMQIVRTVYKNEHAF